MNQSTVLMGGLLAGFVLYLAAGKRWPAYAAIIWPRPVAAQAGGQAATTGPVNNPLTGVQAIPGLSSNPFAGLF